MDLIGGHHFTSTFPTSHFRQGLMVARHGKGRHTTLTHETLTVRRPGEPTEHREITVDELSDLLRELEVPLTGDEEERLLRRVTELRAATS
jgi:N-hydroxyarylamine O-acetyltransferase